jgi:hypothetical protein
MIYINEENINEVIVPIHFFSSGTSFNMELINTLDKNTIEITGVTNSSTNSRIYIFDLSSKLSEFKIGTYEYQLKEIDNTVVEEGIVQFGDYTVTTKEYQGKNNKYVQYTK